jgi:hypothetical protein
MIEHKSANDYIEEEARELLRAIWGHQEDMSRASGQSVEFEAAKDDYLEKFFESFVCDFRNAHTVAA